jgi:hypothetical protein
MALKASQQQIATLTSLTLFEKLVSVSYHSIRFGSWNLSCKAVQILITKNPLDHAHDQHDSAEDQ